MNRHVPPCEATQYELFINCEYCGRPGGTICKECRNLQEVSEELHPWRDTANEEEP